MNKLRLLKIRPKGLIAIMLSSTLLLALTTACDEDPEANTLGNILYIDGPGSVGPETTQTYTAGDFGGNITWSVDGNATVTSTDGLTADITFGGVGSATISASGNGFQGSYEVTVSDVSAELAEDGVAMVKGTVKTDGTDDVTFTFTAPLASAPTLTLTSTIGGSVSDLTGSGTTWTATITGGATDGDLVGQLSNVILSDTYGGATSDSIGVNLQVVDNVSPLISGFESSVSDVQDSTEVDISVTLNEAAGAAVDSIYVDVVYSTGGTETIGLSGSGETWSATYLVVEEDDATVSFTLDKSTVTDLAGNPITDLGQAWSATVNIDNTAPEPTFNAEELVNVTLVDGVTVSDSTKVLIITTGSDAVQWIQLAHNSQFIPESIDDFDGEGTGSITSVEGAGSQIKFYYIEQDAAGNISSISRFPELPEGVEDGSEESFESNITISQ